MSIHDEWPDGILGYISEWLSADEVFHADCNIFQRLVSTRPGRSKIQEGFVGDIRVASVYNLILPKYINSCFLNKKDTPYVYQNPLEKECSSIVNTASSAPLGGEEA